MKRLSLIILLSIFLVVIIQSPSIEFPRMLSSSIFAQNPVSVIAPGAKVVKIAEGFRFTEGPAVDPEGNVFFTDQPNDRILKWDTEGELSTFLQPSGRSNGLFFDADGRLLACADEKNQLWSISPDKKVTVLVDQYQGRLLNGPNDLWIHPDNQRLYFTDPYYQRNYWDRGPKEMAVEGVYLYVPGEDRLLRVAEDLEQPNGIVGTPDGKTLYVADIRAGRTYQYEIQPDGGLSNKREFCQMGSDGMTIDSEGNLYLTGEGVTVFDRNGRKLGNIPIDERWTANVCFGGKNRDMLFITAMDSLYAVKMKTTGTQF